VIVIVITVAIMHLRRAGDGVRARAAVAGRRAAAPLDRGSVCARVCE
jgi:hypothetical protein